MGSGEYIRCNTCDKGFSGPEPYQDHLRSQKHLKKAESGGNSVTMPASGSDSLFCELCDMRFSGPVPYAQHMEGSKHRSQKNKKEIMNNLSASLNTSEPEGGIYPSLAEVAPSQQTVVTVTLQKCELCGVSFSGPENAKEHLESKGHKRKVELQDFKQVLGQNNPKATAPCCDDGSGESAQNSHDASVPPVAPSTDEQSKNPTESSIPTSADEQKEKSAVDSESGSPSSAEEQNAGNETLISVKKKHKKPLGCFKIFSCVRTKQNDKRKTKNKVENTTI